MSTTRAAKYLALVDLGKTIQLLDRYTGEWVTGELYWIDAGNAGSSITLTILATKDSGKYTVHADDEITIIGQPSPPTDNPHGLDQAPRAEQLPTPIPAAQAADHAGTVPHFTVNEDGHIEQLLQIRPRRNGKTTALNAAQAAAAHPSNHDYAWDIRTPNRNCYVCGRTEAEHQDEPEHEHIASYQDAEHCILCGERLEYDENGNRK